MNLCWFIGAYFFVFSEYFYKFSSIHNVLKRIIPKGNDEKEQKLIEIFIKGEYSYLKDEEYDFGIAIFNYFVPKNIFIK